MSKIITDENKINKILFLGVEDVIEKDHLKDALFSGRELRVKFGVDPTAPDLHLGHAVPLRKLRQFQDLGHKIVLIIGDFTAKIGDPTGRNEMRKPLIESEIKKNMENYLKHAEKILDLKRVEVHHNSEWFLKEGIQSMLQLSMAGSIQQILRRSDFKKRIGEGSDITVTEMLYPLLQGYDSVKVKADVELGGTDQLFNLLMGRRVQRYYKMPEQDILTTPLLEGTDGIKKMSKSVGNYISLDEKPFSMFEKIMLVPDGLILKYFSLCTDMEPEDIKKMEKRLKTENPKDIKMELAKEIIKIYHSEREARDAQEEFLKVFSKKEKPTDVEEFKVSKKEISLVELLSETKLAKSNSDARRLIEQGGVRINNEVHKDKDEELMFKGGEIVQVGKRRFLKIKI
jgi:tyrosyl-tRNA synthetase